MYNFLDSKLSPKVFCKTPSMDNYEVENLISDNYMNKMRGFIVYSAIKPPVEIEFEFICPVNIHYIILNTMVGSQKCTGIEVFAKNSTCYTLLGKCIYDKPGIVLCNGKKYSEINLPVIHHRNYHLAFFKKDTFSSFLNANRIKIVIFRTERSVPCLGSVEVWGTPSKLCSEKTVRTISYIMEKHNLPSCENSPSNVSDEVIIPDDFKDDLTYEIMTLPMTLPSGKTVDQSTLEKHATNEISFGRKPCDPFTGIKFTDKLRPILNVGLKGRIDMFLLQNLHRQEFYNLKRSLGKISLDNNDRNSCKRFKSEEVYNSSNLDEVILKTKESPHFLSFTEENKINSCSLCKKEFDFLYEVACHHRYCRCCLLNIYETSKCSICNKVFCKKNVKKCNM